MNLAAFAVKNRKFTYFASLLLALAGAGSFFTLGQLEDPAFSIKSAVVSTRYPGASPAEVELEVTDRIEIALQEMPQLDYVQSWSRAGQSLVAVEIKQEFWSDRLPQVWDEMRRKISDVRPSLPPGVMEPVISDDVGDVFGFQLAVIGDGFTAAEMESYAKFLRKEISVIEGVARADLWGVQQRVIHLDVSETQLAALGLSDSSIENTLQEQNLVLDAGSLDVQERRLRISPTGAFTSPEDIGDLTIRPSLTDSLQAGDGAPVRDSELIRIRDIGTVTASYREPPFTQMRFDGQPAIGISITNVGGANVVTVGRAIDQCLAEIIPKLPYGIEVQRVHWMSDVVHQAVNSFLVSFAQAVAIVIVVITIGMGLRMSMVIGSALIMTILGSFILMAIAGVDLQRMSLGALVIALGMMVDNAVVVADGMAVRLQKGMDRTKAAIESANQPAMPLLGATVIGAMAFYPIFASTANAGEYCRTLFTVVGISLMVSWVVSVTLTPLQCIDLLPAPKKKKDGEEDDPYGGFLFSKFRGFLEKSIRLRFLTIGCMVGLLVVSFVGFGQVRQLFFPDSSMNKFMIDVFATEGTRIEIVAADLKEAEQKLLADDRVEGVASFIGAGPPRFYLPVAPEAPNPSYAQLIVNVHDFRDIDAMIDELTPWMQETFDDSLVMARKYGVGPSNTWAFEARISGPAIADPDVLRKLGEEGAAILRENPLAGPVRTDWRERVARLEPRYNQERARWASVTRDDIARTTVRAFDGRTVGLYRENDELLPIILRYTEDERRNFTSIDALQVQPVGSTSTVPLLQVTDGVGVEFEDPVLGRYQRRRTITVQANPIPGATLPELHAAVAAEFKAIELGPGYAMEWGGEYEDTKTAQASLIPGVIPMVVIILLIIVALFNSYRPPIVILLTIPFAMIGVTAGLLVFNVPFGFVALLAAMSLAGMMIKNAIVLLDEANVQIAEGRSQYDAIVGAAMSRLRPVVLAAGTTVLGVVPLLKDVFWIGLSVTIMAGLSFGTVITMVLVPVLYSTVYRLRPSKS